MTHFLNRAGVPYHLIALLSLFSACGSLQAESSVNLNLNGIWEASLGSFGEIPQSFDHKIPVPGLIDLAEPAFSEPYAFGKRTPLADIPEDRRALWYRTHFKTPPGDATVYRLKVGKAMYGTEVWLNGERIGFNPYIFTPGYFDLSKSMRSSGEENQLTIRVGTHYMLLPEGIPYNYDWEVERFLSGIYDSVELLASGPAWIENVQTVPNIDQGSVRAVVEIRGDLTSADKTLNAVVRERDSGEVVGRGSGTLNADGALAMADFTLIINDPKLWSPEHPFLYELETRIATHSQRTVFGLREFHFDPDSNLAVLNGREQYLVGANAAMFRFFEDPKRGTLPWNREWADLWHERNKEMHYRFMRWTIGLPPEIWYEAADEHGLLVVDELCHWGTDKLKPMDTAAWQEEVRRWMRERWNHPSMVIWDTQNESGGPGKAGAAMRHLDLSERPWDTGWGFSDVATDPVESHPYTMRYLMQRPDTDEVDQGIAIDRSKHIDYRDPDFLARHGGLKIFETIPVNPFANPFTHEGKGFKGEINRPVLINEYGRLCWIHRDGKPASGASGFFRKLGYEPSETPEPVLRETAAYYLAAQTEFWRHGRAATAVQHFVHLQADKRKTSDNFIDIETLEWDPYFKKYMPSAFAPVSVMIDLWDEAVTAGEPKEIHVSIINDLPEAYQGTIHLTVVQDGKTLAQAQAAVEVESNGKTLTPITIQMPDMSMRSELHATIISPDGETILSRRRLHVLPQ